MTRAQKRKIFIITLLVLLLAFLAGYYAYYRSTQKLTLDIAPVRGDAVEAPQYLYSFNGGENATRRMQRPVGVLADSANVYVVDSVRHAIDVFNENGRYERSFGTSQTVVPLYIAKNPTNGNLYVSDRRTRSIHVFTPAGKYLREFDPKLPKSELPKFDTKGVQWEPVAMAFGPDGTFYVTEILNGHRLLIFDPSGKFKKAVGTVGMVTDASQSPGLFQFPNGIAVHDGKVYIADSNNRRVQVFDKEGKTEGLVITQGLPRGIAFLGRFASDDASSAARFVVVDTLAHDGTIWSSKGSKLVNFGQQGILEGQFNYPNGVSVGAKNRIFVADTANGRIQVWGWPNEISPVPIPRLPQNWVWCLTPLLLLPFLLLLRKKRFFTTREFVLAMVEAGEVDLMPARRRKWLVTQDDYDVLQGISQGDIVLGDLLNVTEFSESDARAVEQRLEVSYQTAIRLSIAKRSHVFCTEDEDLRRLAKVQEIDVVNRIEFLERFTNRSTQKVESAE